MGQLKRKAPAIVDRRAAEHPYTRARFSPLVVFQEPPAVASPVIPVRSRLLSELSVELLPEGAYPKYQRFPYLDASLFPASPVVPFRYGRDVLAWSEAFGIPAFQRFPYWQEAPLAANPVVPYRFGRGVLEAEQAFVSPQYQRFPYFQEPAPAAASLVIGYRLGQDVLAGVQAFLPLGYYRVVPFQEAPVAAANPVFEFRLPIYG